LEGLRPTKSQLSFRKADPQSVRSATHIESYLLRNTGGVDVSGDFTKTDEDLHFEPSLKLGNLSFGITTKGKIGFSLQATVSTPIISAYNQIDFHSVQRWKARKRIIDGVSVETTYENAFVRQILSQ
jgi:hypothetical protein